MRRVAVLLLMGYAALVLQAVAPLLVPARWVPDLGLLIVLALALHLRSPVAGVAAAACIGFATDLLSGSLLGQHALLRMAAYGVARFGCTRLNLRGGFSQLLFATGLAAAHAAALWALVAFVSPGFAGPLLALRELGSHAAATGLAAPVVTRLVAAIASRLAGDEGPRPMRLEPRTLPL